MPTITLPARCDRAAAEALLPQLAAAAPGDRIVIDGRQVDQIGLAVLQVLVSARRRAGGATIMPSGALLEAGRLAGLSDELFAEGQP